MHFRIRYAATRHNEIPGHPGPIALRPMPHTDDKQRLLDYGAVLTPQRSMQSGGVAVAMRSLVMRSVAEPDSRFFGGSRFPRPHDGVRNNPMERD
jgi:hypothetical protein